MMPRVKLISEPIVGDCQHQSKSTAIHLSQKTKQKGFSIWYCKTYYLRHDSIM